MTFLCNVCEYTCMWFQLALYFPYFMSIPSSSSPSLFSPPLSSTYFIVLRLFPSQFPSSCHSSKKALLTSILCDMVVWLLGFMLPHAVDCIDCCKEMKFLASAFIASPFHSSLCVTNMKFNLVYKEVNCFPSGNISSIFRRQWRYGGKEVDGHCG